MSSRRVASLTSQSGYVLKLLHKFLMNNTQIERTKIITFAGESIYLIRGLIVLFPDLSLEQGGGISRMFFKEPVEIRVIFEI